MSGQVLEFGPAPLGPVGGVVAGVADAATCAAGTFPEALAVAAVREATPKPSPARPATAAPTTSNRLVIRFILSVLIGGTPRPDVGRMG